MGTLRAGLIGCGGFARGMHIPNLEKNPKYTIHAAMDIDAEAAKKAGDDTGAEYSTTDLDRILSDESVDVVFITTRHDTHAELTVKAAEAGKHVFCEKPMGMNRGQCRAVAEAVKQNRVKYTVGYNRGMAPLVTRARNLLAGIPDKKLVYHRIQAPFPANIWTHDPAVGGGRFVGEGCHIFDLLCELVPAEPVSVYAAGGVFLDPAQVTIPDSGIITIGFADGSVGTTLIASAGCADFPKEATEVYCAGRAIHIMDFKAMEYFGFEGPGKHTVELDAQDKGQAAEIDQLADAIVNDTAPPNGLVNASRAAVISFMAYESIAQGKPLALSKSDYVF